MRTSRGQNRPIRRNHSPDTLTLTVPLRSSHIEPHQLVPALTTLFLYADLPEPILTQILATALRNHLTTEEPQP